ncbi:DUF2505 domain-containing protein [Nocardioides xinjiangensis]|uniref:DUF2505 domain-containing protein n=1 Tax=Nocardioides xinjiangensis TaxID=2817376 RepID=UPI001B30275E|nr:DUF2505 domain-containing protein [Nocardioides sp. SYSU D00778]
MGKRVVKDLTYDAPLEEVAAMLTDPAFREQVLDRMKVVRGEVTVEAGVVTIDQVQSAAGLPSFATKLVGDEIRIVQVEAWRTPGHADVEVTIPGKPGEMTGTAALTESGGRTTERIDLEITVRIPLIGGKIEGLVADMLGKALEKEHETGVEWLARR